MPLTEQQLNELALQEAQFFSGIASIIEWECGLYLLASSFDYYVGANRALALRDDGRGAKAVAEAVITFYKERGIPPAAELDAVAESQGIGSALRRGGLRNSLADRLLMRYTSDIPPLLTKRFEVEHVPNGTESEQVRDWLDISVSHETTDQDREDWYGILLCDAHEDTHKLFIAYDHGKPASCCQLFTDSGYGRIDDVMTRPEFERRGLAAAVVAFAVTESLNQGNHTTFLYCDAGSTAEALYRKLGFVVWERNLFRRHFTPAP